MCQSDTVRMKNQFCLCGVYFGHKNTLQASELCLGHDLITVLRTNKEH